jgi:hypothetical protein
MSFDVQYVNIQHIQRSTPSATMLIPYVFQQSSEWCLVECYTIVPYATFFSCPFCSPQKPLTRNFLHGSLIHDRPKNLQCSTPLKFKTSLRSVAQFLRSLYTDWMVQGFLFGVEKLLTPGLPFKSPQVTVGKPHHECHW